MSKNLCSFFFFMQQLPCRKLFSSWPAPQKTQTGCWSPSLMYLHVQGVFNVPVCLFAVTPCPSFLEPCLPYLFFPSHLRVKLSYSSGSIYEQDYISSLHEIERSSTIMISEYTGQHTHLLSTWAQVKFRIRAEFKKKKLMISAPCLNWVPGKFWDYDWCDIDHITYRVSIGFHKYGCQHPIVVGGGV